MLMFQKNTVVIITLSGDSLFKCVLISRLMDVSTLLDINDSLVKYLPLEINKI